MGFWDDALRVGTGIATGGTSELVNEATGGGMWGSGSAFINNPGGPGDHLKTYENPPYPQYINGYDPATQSLAQSAANYTNNVQGQFNTRGINQYRNEATRTGPSAWAGLARAQVGADEANKADQFHQEAAGNAATARSRLAQQGGLTGGAAERVATNANRDAMMASQKLAGQGVAQRARIGATDEANRIKELQALPGMEVDQLRPAEWAAQTNLGAQQNDINNMVGEAGRRNDFNMGLYTNLMQQNQANRNADVIAATAPKDRGFIGNIFGGLFG